ncbi:MAG: hypothetical protein GX213_02180 [Clostridiaceae bacterium]|nr:hypothetical protein [Clostridiaceae bacterium]
MHYESDENLAHTRQYIIFGDDKKFIYKKNNKYYIYDINRDKKISEFESFADLQESQEEFIKDYQYQYVNRYERLPVTES